ncbi:30S ribosomal protein S4 [Candidatus Micrarchaeota archaeon]|jgi:small subunit ribosomal protein S4|nr:30S ribosomal protein S4 [Candidatus Micrarchaeota archaeon]
MGDPRRLKKRYSSPGILWDKQRIKEEKGLVREFGLKNMKELWRAEEGLRKVRREARRFQSLGEESIVESTNLINKLKGLGIVAQEATIDDLLNLKTRDFLERRLQTQVFKSGLARTVKQARQLITHGFIFVDGKKVSKPSYMVNLDEARTISYSKTIDINAGVQREIIEEVKAHAVVEHEKNVGPIPEEGEDE